MRYLSDLIGDDIDHKALPTGWEQVDIMAITADSRAVKPGTLFAALPGSKVDGRHYIADALAKGAVAILTDHVPEELGVLPVPVLHSANPRHSLALIAARFYDLQPAHIALVTGTDGKTSTAHFYQQLWRLLGSPAASIGTLGVVGPTGLPGYPALHTTPDPVQLHYVLKDLARHGISYAAIEASSHGLDQHRLDGVRCRVAGFTNLTRDHLDYHHTVEAYFAAKARLFSEVLVGGGIAVLNADESHFAELDKLCHAHGQKVLDYGRDAKALKLLELRPYATGQHIRISVYGVEYELDVPLIGGFQVYNILCAFGMAIGSGADAAKLAEAVAKLQGVPGRLEHVATAANGAPVFVDYAHTPGGLESVLTHIRPHVTGKLHVVFGCGGDRDRGKRPQMGRIAVEKADIAYVTDDNPRTEDAAFIRSEVMAGAQGAVEITGGRKLAILEAVKNLQAGDALVIAGKGHEKYQIIGTESHPFDDAQVAREATG